MAVDPHIAQSSFYAQLIFRTQNAQSPSGLSGDYFAMSIVGRVEATQNAINKRFFQEEAVMIELESRVSHQLGQDSAIKKLREFVGTLPQRFPQQVHQVTMKLHEDSVEVQFAAYGYRVQWTAEVHESTIVLRGLIPISAKKFKDKILCTVVDRIEDAMRVPVATQLRRVA